MAIEVFDWMAKEDNFRSNMYCYRKQIYDTNKAETVCENIKLIDYPYKVMNNNKLCTPNATQSQVDQATLFDDPQHIREIFSEYSEYILALNDRLLLPYMINLFPLCAAEIVLYYESRKIKRLPLIPRISIILFVYYCCFYWIFDCFDYFLSFSIKFGGCIEMQNPADIDHLFETKSISVYYLVFGIIYPIFSIAILALLLYYHFKRFFKISYNLLFEIGLIILNIVFLILIGIQFASFRKVFILESIDPLNLLWVYIHIIVNSRLCIGILPNISKYFISMWKKKNILVFPGIDYEPL